MKGFFDSLIPTYLKERWKSLFGVSELASDHYAVFKSTVKDTAVTRGSLRDALGPIVPRRRGVSNQRICSYEEFREKVKPRLLPRHELVATVKGDACGPRRGIAQGTPISATLANLYMLEMDVQFENLASASGGIYRRYSDDLIFVVPKGRGIAIEKSTVSLIKSSGLEIQTAKTERLVFNRSGAKQTCDKLDEAGKVIGPSKLDYLGFTFDGLGVTIRDSTVSN